MAAELAVSGRYGFLQDELYFIEAGRHLAFGYVDQPPLAPLLTRVTGILGVSPTAIRTPWCSWSTRSAGCGPTSPTAAC